MGIPAIDRKSFSKKKQLTSLPDLLSLQVHSWDDLLQEDILPEKRENKGLEAVFKNIFPVKPLKSWFNILWDFIQKICDTRAGISCSFYLEKPIKCSG